ncbi:DUF7000 family protein [Proteiniclasticum sp. C24MP]|uniref:DUF7000 family protein n=1 Tax=Proteiniclasticum sp. C24MP TaxID=3374101 RepID=UPI00375496BE
MGTVQDQMKEYRKQLQKGMIQKAYGEIMGFMNDLKGHLKKKYKEHQISSLYQGYMDMTYFSFTPKQLKERNLKIAVVYLHEENRFEVWLSGVNKSVAKEYMEKLKTLETPGYEMKESPEGVDFITTMLLTNEPDFEQKEKLRDEIELRCISFGKEMTELTDQVSC